MIRPLDNQSEGSDSFDPSPYINDLFTCTIKRLKAADIDQEVKERAISCMGQIICNLGESAGGRRRSFPPQRSPLTSSVCVAV